MCCFVSTLYRLKELREFVFEQTSLCYRIIVYQYIDSHRVSVWNGWIVSDSLCNAHAHATIIVVKTLLLLSAISGFWTLVGSRSEKEGGGANQKALP